MPYVARLFIKTAVVYLAVTFAGGAVLLTLEALHHPAPFVFDVEHGHAGFVGWLVNMVFGVALWLLPLNRRKFPQTQGRYPETTARASFYALNAGLVLRLFGEPWFDIHPSVAGTATLAAAAVLQLAGALAFAWIAWHRIFAPPLRPDF